MPLGCAVRGDKELVFVCGRPSRRYPSRSNWSRWLANILSFSVVRLQAQTLRRHRRRVAVLPRHRGKRRYQLGALSFMAKEWRDALKHYPEPRHATIVEPFAGSAGFALRYADRKVILCEIDPVLAAVWRYLIRVKAKEILSIPDLAPGESVDDLKISPGSFWGNRVRQTIASQVDAIRH